MGALVILILGLILLHDLKKDGKAGLNNEHPGLYFPLLTPNLLSLFFLCFSGLNSHGWRKYVPVKASPFPPKSKTTAFPDPVKIYAIAKHRESRLSLTVWLSVTRQETEESRIILPMAEFFLEAPSKRQCFCVITLFWISYAVICHQEWCSSCTVSNS